jgi:serine palmitoyltransferase
MELPIVKATTAVLARVSAAFNAPLACSVVLGVHVDGSLFYPTNNLTRFLVYIIFGIFLMLCHFSARLVVEGLLIAVIIFQLSRKSYRPPKKALSKKVGCFFCSFSPV